ncbi:MAG: hypothetical protein M3406_15850 [Chloroflexota bacterium]|nr:hypothetical protein [Chloroflexota bacterium]
MSRSTFDLLRLPAALILLAIVAFFLWPRGDSDQTSDLPNPTPRPSVIVGIPGGEVFSPSAAPSAATTPIPTLSPPPTPEPTPEPTQEPTPEPTPEPTVTPLPTQAPAADGFAADVLVCGSISGSTCNEQLTIVRDGLASFTALIRFTNANAGDTISVVLNGPSGTIAGGPYTLQGSGDGYYFSTVQAGGLAAGRYTVTATRNGGAVATTSFTKGG